MGVITFEARVKTRARRCELVLDDCEVTIFIKAAPVEGRANEEAIRLIARALGLPNHSVELIRGRRSRTKCFRVTTETDAPQTVRALFETHK
jgi:uncharacterized protein YggU (UPF0235/DUF167 family)